MTIADCFVSVVMPVRNEERHIESVVRETTAILRAHYENYELVLVDDGSTDATAGRISALLGEIDCVRLVRLSRHFGHDVAIFAGLDTVIGDYVVTAMPVVDPPELIPAAVELARRNRGIVAGMHSAPRRRSFTAAAGARLFYFIANRFLALNIPEHSTDFRVFTRQAVNAVLQIKEKFKYLRVSLTYIGFPLQPFPYEQRRRDDRREGRSFVESVELAMNAMVASSTRLLRIVTWLGLVASALNVMYMGYIVMIAIFKKNVAEGWITLSAQHAGMFFFIFIILIVLAEYIGRILAESQDRPSYYVLEEKSSSVLLSNRERRNVVTGVASDDEP